MIINSWRKLAGMNVPRREFAFAVVGGLLYVIRGFSSDGECLQSSEVYDPETNQWSLMDDCPDRPDFHRAFAFSFKSKLFVVGGNIKSFGHGKLSFFLHNLMMMTFFFRQ